jgi:hypothetical protein
MPANSGTTANSGMLTNSKMPATPAATNMKPTLVQVRAKLNEALNLMSNMS